MLNFGASKPIFKGDPGAGAPLDPYLCNTYLESVNNINLE